MQNNFGHLVPPERNRCEAKLLAYPDVRRNRAKFTHDCSFDCENRLAPLAIDGNPDFVLYEAIYTTRAMRRLKPDPVPSELISKIIEAATMGPSGGNRQPWMFVVVTNPDTKAFIAERYRKAWDMYFTPKSTARVEKERQSHQG